MTSLPQTDIDQIDWRAALRRGENNLLDFDIVVDDCRREVDRALEALRAALRDRDRAATRLAHLITTLASILRQGTDAHGGIRR